MPFQVFSIGRQLSELVRFDVVKGRRKAHFAESVMVTVRLPVGPDVDRSG
jgi:hypothetical protein